ncbi:MAG: hypothetical protein Kow00107_03840 [Planctomycetota bacterium]
MALDRDGNVWVWGDNSSCQFARTEPDYSSAPVKVRLPEKAIQVQCACDACIVLLKDGRVYCWGSNAMFAYGNDTKNLIETPMAVPNLPPMKAINCKSFNITALTEDGKVWQWGLKAMHNGTRWVESLITPHIVQGLPKITQVSAAERHVLALDESGQVWAWGANPNGEIGMNVGPNCEDPTPVLGMDSIKKLATGQYVSVAFEE